MLLFTGSVGTDEVAGHPRHTKNNVKLELPKNAKTHATGISKQQLRERGRKARGSVPEIVLGRRTLTTPHRLSPTVRQRPFGMSPHKRRPEASTASLTDECPSPHDASFRPASFPSRYEHEHVQLCRRQAFLQHTLDQLHVDLQLRMYLLDITTDVPRTDVMLRQWIAEAKTHVLVEKNE